eukprot:TRINITY_DN9986_c0_g1::TRINITY_DN9986_c0_g1_i1::g.29241::m.29241 TRINITY_DN9986_c0_g1::TRINITY_DN9986_c0_g1_i1::g.29241  ORF type:complete len:218 (+),score=30.84,sp/P54168/YPGQ_BACSU/35.07/1e-29,HD/PF01966.17/1.7e-10 TRINITY_DN9986_c0_g1_i1:29-655(+)
MGSLDASHDWNHILRVRTLALRIADEESKLNPNFKPNLEIVELAALLHDVADHKYTDGSHEACKTVVSDFLKSVDCEIYAETVATVVNGVSFSKEVSAGLAEISPELRCVQDADRLDAIGAIGIARCFTFGGIKKRSFYDACNPPAPVPEDGSLPVKKDGTTLDHFFEKLLRLPSMMKTTAGRRLADGRHQLMVDFINQFSAEIQGTK